MSIATADIYTQVAPPPLQLPPYGLFSASQPITPAGADWQLGIQWTTDACVTGGVTQDPCVTDADPADLAFLDCDNRLSTPVKPFTVYAYTRRPMQDATAQEGARAILEASEQRQVEAGLWDALVAATLVTAVVADVDEALATIEQHLRRQYGGLGVIHMSVLAASLLGDKLTPSGGRLLTNLGTPVVAGGGYGADIVTAVDPLVMFGTGALVIMRGPIEPGIQVRELRQNNLYTLVQRTYVVGWDCLTVGTTAAP